MTPEGRTERLQRRRTKGWRMPEGAVYVGRPTMWGNDFPVGFVADLNVGGSHYPRAVRDNTDAVNLFIEWQAPGLRWAAREELAGRDLLCWCRVGDPCHADVLLLLANEPRVVPTHDAGCEERCNHCQVCGKGTLYGSRCHAHPNPLSGWSNVMRNRWWRT